MFKKLKIKFIATIMILLTSIVLIIFGVIFYTTKINNENALFSQMLASSGAFNERKESNTNELHNIEGILVMISFSDYSMKYKSSYDLDESEITELVITNKVRSKGIGRELMKVMEDYFKENDCEYVLVDVFAYNDNAIKFYERSGYHPRMLVDIKKL